MPSIFIPLPSLFSSVCLFVTTRNLIIYYCNRRSSSSQVCAAAHHHHSQGSLSPTLGCSLRKIAAAHHHHSQGSLSPTLGCSLRKALLYRLSGDYNPLHSDPKVAEIAGFSRSIQHGLCTMGFVVRAIIKCICRGDPNMIKNISGRFLLHVYPGETLIMEMWLEGLRVVYQVKVKERNKAVLSGIIDLTHLTSSL